jgi:hypothetical protein
LGHSYSSQITDRQAPRQKVGATPRGRLKKDQNLILSTVLREPFARAVVELGGHFLRVLERAAIGEISGDPGCAECV